MHYLALALPISAFVRLRRVGAEPFCVRLEILTSHQPLLFRDRHTETVVGGSPRRRFACRQQLGRASGSGVGSLSA